MKKGLCVILSAMLIAMSFSACSKKNGNDAETQTKVDANGQTYVEVTNKKGETVTDADGKAITSLVAKEEKNKDSSDKEDKAEKAGKTDSSKEDKKNDKKETKKDNGKSTSLQVNTDVLNNVTDVDEDNFDMFADEKDLYEEGTTTKKTTLFEDKVQKILKTGKFTIDMAVTSEGKQIPMKLAFAKDKMYASFEMQGMQAGIIYMNDTAYILFPNIFKGVKAYMEYPDADESMGEVFDSFNQISDSNGKYKGSSKVKVGSKTYTCEEYAGNDGTTFKYYFDGNDWKRYECISEEGNMVYEINSFSGKVDENLFSLKGYTKIDEKALEALGGTLS